MSGASTNLRRHRRRRLSRFASDRPFAEGRARVIAIDNLITGNLDEHRASRRERELPVHQAGRFAISFSCRKRSRLRFSFRLAGEPDRLPRAADPDAESRRARHAQRARPGEGEEGDVPSRLDLGVLRRSAGSSAEGRLLGQREPDRAARRLRRGEAFRRGDDDGLPPLSRDRYEDRAHLQYLRSAHAVARRAGGAGVYRPGAERISR